MEGTETHGVLGSILRVTVCGLEAAELKVGEREGSLERHARDQGCIVLARGS